MREKLLYELCMSGTVCFLPSHFPMSPKLITTKLSRQCLWTYHHISVGGFV